MKRILYLGAEIGALYAVLLLPVLGLLYFGLGWTPTHQLLFIGTALALAPFAVVEATVGTRASIWSGIYRPTRILSFLLTSLDAFRDTSTLAGFGKRRAVRFSYRSDRPIASYDVISALSLALQRQGIAHNNAGALHVEDNGTTWSLEAVFGRQQVVGWVQSDDPRDRAQVIAGIRSFLAEDLGLEVT